MTNSPNLSSDEEASAGHVFRIAVGDALVVILTFLVMFMGVGQLSAEAGLNAVQTALMTSLTVAAPAQAAAMQILTSEGATAGAWAAAVVAVIIVNLRFIVMVASVLARLPETTFWRALGGVGLISASSFAVILPRLMEEPPPRPILYCGMVGGMCSLSAVIGAVTGHQLAASVPVIVGATLGAMIPIYFATLIARQKKLRPLMVNALFGALLVPLGVPFMGASALLVLPLIVAGLSMLVDQGKQGNA
ncbi:AzlC family ABC transporter permease [Afifella sp. H1R]|uniref:AzlC family ABC transporter permease n=1 Tax=Afifella sp. H1R TaxID=2908841 RepID=UPI001F40B784|nr:AzlC family ABC transporter permease [Afifella sp. H1R]MCF1503060.1 AzlC family ABC transporter permease [Afifella sp. H1R]